VESSLLAASAATTKPIAFLTLGARRKLFLGADFAAGTFVFRLFDDPSLTWANTSSLGLGGSQNSRVTKRAELFIKLDLLDWMKAWSF
jgi:hypothetical protein